MVSNFEKCILDYHVWDNPYALSKKFGAENGNEITVIFLQGSLYMRNVLTISLIEFEV